MAGELLYIFGKGDIKITGELLHIFSKGDLKMAGELLHIFARGIDCRGTITHLW